MLSAVFCCRWCAGSDKAAAGVPDEIKAAASAAAGVPDEIKAAAWAAAGVPDESTLQQMMQRPVRYREG